MAAQHKIIVILGQTATGKTKLAISLAKKYGGEIICADSRTIYKGMDVGTAKPTLAEMQGIKHHLIDVVEPNESFSVVDFKTLCQKYLDSILKKGKLPIIVGGSGLYLDAVLFDYNFRSSQGIDTGSMTDAEIVKSAKKLYGEDLGGVDSKNIRRVAQLLERGPSNSSDRSSLKLHCKIIGLMLEKPVLKKNIEIRTEQMLDNGFVQEVEKLRKIYGRDCPALNTTGYHEVSDFLDGRLKPEELGPAIVAATLKLAKKQATWFKRNHHIEWASDHSHAEALAESYLKDSLVQ